MAIKCYFNCPLTVELSLSDPFSLRPLTGRPWGSNAPEVDRTLSESDQHIERVGRGNFDFEKCYNIEGEKGVPRTQNLQKNTNKISKIGKNIKYPLFMLYVMLK